MGFANVRAGTQMRGRAETGAQALPEVMARAFDAQHKEDWPSGTYNMLIITTVPTPVVHRLFGWGGGTTRSIACLKRGGHHGTAFRLDWSVEERAFVECAPGAADHWLY